MKKTLLLTVLILSLVLSVTSQAAVTESTPKLLFKSPEVFWNGGETLTWTNAAGTTTYSSPAGVLPNSSNWLSTPYGTADFVNGGNVAPNPGLGFRSAGTASAVAYPTTDNSSNAVFKLTGSSAHITDTGAPNVAINRYSAKVNLSTVSEGETVLLRLGSGYVTTTLGNSTGIYLKNGGAYIKKVVSVATDGTATCEEVEFIPAGTMLSDVWYTVESVIDVVADRYIMQDARIYDENGTLIAKSGWYFVSNQKKSTDTNKYNAIQCSVSNFSINSGVMIDDWEVYSISGADKGAMTFETVTDRSVYRFKSSLPLDGSAVTNDLVTVTSPAEDMTGKYNVTYDSANNAIVVTFPEKLKFTTSYTIALDETKPLATDEGYLAFDYSNTTVLETMSKTFTTGPDLFVVDGAAFDVSGNATVTFTNGDSEAREYMIIVSFTDADGKYLQTECVHGYIPAGAVAQQITAPTVTTSPGGEVCVKVWDNWKTQTPIGDVYTQSIPLE